MLSDKSRNFAPFLKSYLYFDMDKVSYSLGMGIGHQLMQMGATDLNIDDFAAAIKDVLAGNKLAVGDDEAHEIVEKFFRDQETKQRAAASKRFEANRIAGEKYLEDNKQKAGVKVTESGLQYLVLEEGNGRSPKATDSVKCHYEGMLTDGTMFDSSIQRGEPATFPLNGVIAGWTEGLQLMKEGSRFRFFIPYQLGYGERGAGQSIPPYSALIFDVELIEVL